MTHRATRARRAAESANEGSALDGGGDDRHLSLGTRASLHGSRRYSPEATRTLTASFASDTLTANRVSALSSERGRGPRHNGHGLSPSSP
jgi:hypothetical protein